MKKDDLKDIADADRIEAFVWTYIIGSLENLYDWMVTQHMELLEAYRNES